MPISQVFVQLLANERIRMPALRFGIGLYSSSIKLRAMYNILHALSVYINNGQNNNFETVKDSGLGGLHYIACKLQASDYGIGLFVSFLFSIQKEARHFQTAMRITLYIQSISKSHKNTEIKLKRL